MHGNYVDPDSGQVRVGGLGLPTLLLMLLSMGLVFADHQGDHLITVREGVATAPSLGGTSHSAIPPVAVTAVDTTGAGDAFIGSFACFLAQGAEPEAALTRAALYAADSITRRGTQKSYASAADFARFEAEHEARP